MGDILRADPSSRRRAVTIVVLGALVGSLAILAFERYRPWLERWIVSDPERFGPRLTAITVLLILALTIPSYAFAAHLWVRGRSVRRSGRFPLEGERVVRDTPILYGDAAARRGRVLECLAVALAVVATIMGVTLWLTARAVG
jgi:hypothetical protein